MHRFPKLILVPTDFSAVAARALRYATSLASRTGAHLLVVHACGFDPATAYIDVTVGGARFSEKEFAERTREELLRHVEENVTTDILFDVRVVTLPPTTAIVSLAHEAGCDLIIMGSHGRTGISHFLFGSVTEEVIRTTTIPVIAVPARAREQAGVMKVLCPVSFTPECRQALRTAAELVETRRAPLVLLRSMETDDIQEKYDELIQLRDWLPRELIDRCELKVVSASEAKDVARIAEETYTDLIVLAVPSDRSLQEVLGGTFAERVIHESRCPVLVVTEAKTIPAALMTRARAGRDSRP